MFKINKWHKGKSGKGYVVELCFYDEEREKWRNAKVYIPDASQYAGSDDAKPAALAGVVHPQTGGELLVIKCYRKDNYTGTRRDEDGEACDGVAARETKKKPAPRQPELPDASRKGRGNVTATPSNVTDGDDDMPF